MSKARKPPAADRTIDIFSGRTKEEEANEAERIQQGLDIVAQERGPGLTIEQAADKWRANAFVGQEWSTKNFGSPSSDSNEYRTTLKSGMLYLEKTAANPGTRGAFSYAGLMFPEEDAPKLATAIVAAAKAYLAKVKK